MSEFSLDKEVLTEDTKKKPRYERVCSFPAALLYLLDALSTSCEQRMMVIKKNEYL